MANFWLGASQGLQSGWEMGSSIAERKRTKKEKEAAAALKARIRNEALALSQERYDTEQEQKRDAIALAGRQYQDEQTRLARKADIDKEVIGRAKEGRMRGLRAKIAEADRASQQEASKIRGGFQMGGLGRDEGGFPMEARTLDWTPEQFQALSEDELGVIAARSTAVQKKQDEAEAKMQPTFQTQKPTPEEEAHARKMIVRVNLGLDLNATDEEVQAQLAANKAEPAKRLPYKLAVQGPKDAMGRMMGAATGISIEALAGEDMTPANWMRAMRQRSSLANSFKPPLKIDIFQPVFAPEQMGETIAIEAFKFDADPAKNEEIKVVMRDKKEGELFKVGNQYFIKKGDTLIEVKDK